MPVCMDGVGSLGLAYYRDVRYSPCLLMESTWHGRTWMGYFFNSKHTRIREPV